MSIELKPGITGLLGPNGAGKTTLMRLAAGVSRPDAGTVHTNGYDTGNTKQARKLRGSMGYLPQSASWRDSLTVRDFLRYFAWLRGIPRREVDAAITFASESVKIQTLQGRKLGQLSGGELRRTMLAQTLLHRPSLLLLDEPTAGLDPAQRHHFRGVLRSLRADMSTIISTHLLEDVSELADELLVMDAGRVLFRGSPRQLGRTVGDDSGSVEAMQMGYLKVLAAEQASA